MVSVSSVLSALVLLSELSGRRSLAAVATPGSKGEDGVLEQDGFFLEGGEPLMEAAVVPLAYGQNLVLDGNAWDEGGNPKIIVVSDARLKGRGVRGLGPAFGRSLPPLADQSLSFTPAERAMKMERRNSDIDMLRCMIGRVYRPCWN